MANHIGNWVLATGLSLLGWSAIAPEIEAATLILGEQAEVNLEIDLGFNAFRDGLNLISQTSQNSEKKASICERPPSGLKVADHINESLRQRYQGLIEEGLLEECPETVSQLQSNPLLIAEGLIETIDSQSVIGKTIANAENGEKQSTNPLVIYILLGMIPVLGLGGLMLGNILLERSKSNKPEVPDNSILLHKQAWHDLQFFGQMAASIDSNKFTNQEFLLFVRVKYLLGKGLEDYQGLENSLPLLEVAIRAKDSFLKIEQGELRYRGFKQQQFYEFVQERLAAELPTEAFRGQVQSQLTALIPQVKTEEGKVALQAYASELDRLAEHELGLKLLSLFKQYQLGDYTILRTIADMVETRGESHLQDFKGLVATVMVHYDIFEKLGQIIGIPRQQNSPEIYAKMIQYLALANRHQQSYQKFEELVEILRKWYKPYQVVARIRQAYSADDYQIPKEFTEEIPGLAIYQKYKNWLTDKKTGYTYVDFGDMN